MPIGLDAGLRVPVPDLVVNRLGIVTPTAPCFSYHKVGFEQYHSHRALVRQIFTHHICEAAGNSVWNLAKKWAIMMAIKVLPITFEEDPWLNFPVAESCSV